MASTPEHISMALFCDFENVALGVRDANYEKFDIKRVLERLLLKGSIVVKKAYCDWDRYKSFKAAMHEANFELIEIPHVRQSGKNSADIRLVVDALDLCYTKSHVDTFVIISGDSDFSPLVSKLRENAKTVIGVGVKNSTSDLLIANCDEFIYYDDLVRGQPSASRARVAARGAAARGQATRPEAAKAGAGAGAGKGDGGRSEAAKGEASRAEAAKGEVPRAEAAKADAPRRRGAKAAASKAAGRNGAAAAVDLPETEGVAAAPGGDQPVTAEFPGADLRAAEGMAAGPAHEAGASPEPSPEERAQQALDLVVDTIEALAAERGEDEKIWGSMVKQTLKRRRPGFNETYYGYRSFNRLLEEARERGLIELERDEKSGGYTVRSLA